VSTAKSFSAGGHQYVFDGWDPFPGSSDRDSRVQTFTIPDDPGGLSLTARYRDVTPTIVQPAPAPVLPPPDHTGPRLRFKKLRKGVVSGTVSDVAGVRSVYVALGRKNAHQRCRWWAASAGKLARTAVSCAKPRWIRAKLEGGAWTAKLGRKPVPRGSYRLLIRARDKLGNPTDEFRRVRIR
jgi:hypothetical protein